MTDVFLKAVELSESLHVGQWGTNPLIPTGRGYQEADCQTRIEEKRDEIRGSNKSSTSWLIGVSTGNEEREEIIQKIKQKF